MIVSLETVQGWFPTAPAGDLTVAHAAAEDYVSSRCRWATVDADGIALETPQGLVQTVKLLTSRYLARRNSPDGIVGMDDLGAVRVAGTDRDVEALIRPYRPVVFG